MTDQSFDRAFEVIYREHHRMVATYLFSLTGNWAETAELAQDTFIIAYRKMHEFEGNATLQAWLRGIARNLAFNAFRKKSRRATVLAGGPEGEELFSLFDRELEKPWNDRLLALEMCKAKLPEAQKGAIDRHYGEGRTAREIAALDGVLAHTVFQWLWQARKNLRECIERATREVAHA